MPDPCKATYVTGRGTSSEKPVAQVWVVKGIGNHVIGMSRVQVIRPCKLTPQVFCFDICVRGSIY